MKQEQLITMAFVLVVAGVAFFGGIKYQQLQQPTRNQFAGRQGGMQQQGGNRAGFRPVTGTILSVANGTMTVKLEDGSSKIVVVPDSAAIDKSAPVLKTELTAGTTVMVMGAANSDGSVTAQTIQLNPIRRGAPGASAQPTSK